MAGIEIARRDMTAAQLRSASAKAPDARSARRMLAIALVLDGADRATAANGCGMDRQTLRDWAHRYNAEESWPRLSGQVPADFEWISAGVC